MIQDEVPEKPKPAFGLTRHGEYSSPNPLVIGRHESTQRFQGSPGFCFYEEQKFGKYKPRALLLSRYCNNLTSVVDNLGLRSKLILPACVSNSSRPKSRQEVLDPEFTNTFGLTRFGKAATPTTILRGRPYVKKTFSPGRPHD